MNKHITIRKTQQKLANEIVEHGKNFKMWYDQGDVLSVQSKDIEYPMNVSKDHVKSQIGNGKLSCNTEGKCYLTIHSNKFYSFDTDPILLPEKKKK